MSKYTGKSIIKYLRRRDNRICGALVAIRDKHSRVLIGWGLIHPKDAAGMTVKEIKKAAYDTAIGRALEARKDFSPIPSYVEKALDDFINRSEKYFDHDKENPTGKVIIGYPAPK